MNRHLFRGSFLTPAAAAFLLILSGVASAEDVLEKTFPLAAGGRFELRTGDGSVRIHGTSGNEVHLKVTSKGRSLSERLDFTYETRPDEVIVRARNVHHFLNFSWNDSVRFEIDVPFSARTDIHTSGGSINASSLKAPVELSTSGGSLEIRDVSADVRAATSGGGITIENLAGNIRVSTSGGSIDAQTIRGPLSAETSGGWVKIDNVSGDCRVGSSGGSIRVENAGGRVDVEGSGGGIEVAFARGNARGGRIDSSGGNVTVAVDSSAHLDVDASGDSVRTELPLDVEGRHGHDRVNGRLNGGGERLSVSTSGGSVHIKALK